jgi:hypothetical protein
MQLSPSLSAGDWSLTPLGAPVTRPPAKEAVKRQELKSPKERRQTGDGKFVAVDGGVAKAAIVVGGTSQPAAMLGAKLIQSVIKTSTGAELPILQEERSKVEVVDGRPAVVQPDGKRWDHAIWIGETSEAKRQGVTASDLKPEGFRVKAGPDSVVIIGNDLTHAGKPGTRIYGTLFGCVSLLESEIGARWLWPGKDGTIIPPLKTAAISSYEEKDEPAISQRGIRSVSSANNNRVKAGLDFLGFTPDDIPKELENRDWFDFNRVGGSVQYTGGHAYPWHEKFGADHPDWFALQPNGTRVQTSSNRSRLCKSNPAVAEQKAREVLDQVASGLPFASFSISPNDGGDDSFCMCEECRKLDPANAKMVSMRFIIDGKPEMRDYPSLSDRVAVFYNRIAEAVAKKSPDTTLGAYAYSAYRDAPLGVTLHPSILIGFVGLNYGSDKERSDDLARWNAWTYAASRLYLRPNAFHVGSGLPQLYPRRLAKDIKHCYETGMIASDFDSIMNYWSTQGLNYYITAKLLWNPSADVEELISDYCRAGFGPAAPQVQAYFDKLEKATTELAGRFPVRDTPEQAMRDEEVTEPVKMHVKPFYKAYASVFSEERMKKLHAMLDEAQKAAGPDEAVVKRIDFLRTGLEYGDRKSAMFRELLAGSDAVDSRTKLAAYYKSAFQKHPVALYTPYLAYVDSGYLRGIPKP